VAKPQKKPERKKEEMKDGRLGGILRGAAPATILTDGAAHRASQAGPTQLTHLSWWCRETGGPHRRSQEPLLIVKHATGTSASGYAGDRNLCFYKAGDRNLC
jgi:hypothetical protein